MEFECTIRDIFDLETGQTTIINIPVIDCFFNKQGIKFPIPVSCLLDSGADFITLPIEFARHFKVNTKELAKKTTSIVGGGIIKVYVASFEDHKIIISIPGLKKMIKETIHFCEGQKIPLLGRNFFNHFDILFKKGGEKFAIS